MSDVSSDLHDRSDVLPATVHSTRAQDAQLAGSGLLALAARSLFCGYTFMLLAIGASGLFLAEWELPHLFGVRLGDMDRLTRATLLNQYGFLKSAELGFGVFAAVCRWEIFSVHRFNQIFLVGLFGGVFARSLSSLRDGAPHWAFLVFLALELATGVLVLISSRKTLRLSGAR